MNTISKLNQDGATALHVAAYHHHIAVLELLVDASSNLDKGNKVMS